MNSSDVSHSPFQIHVTLRACVCVCTHLQLISLVVFLVTFFTVRLVGSKLQLRVHGWILLLREKKCFPDCFSTLSQDS